MKTGKDMMLLVHFYFQASLHLKITKHSSTKNKQMGMTQLKPECSKDTHPWRDLKREFDRICA